MMSSLLLIFIAIIINISVIFGYIRRLNRISMETYKKLENSGEECFTQEQKPKCPIEQFFKRPKPESITNITDLSDLCDNIYSERSSNKTSTSNKEMNEIGLTPAHDKYDIKCDEGLALNSVQYSINHESNDEMTLTYTCINIPHYGCKEIQTEKVLTSETNPFSAISISSLSEWTVDNKIINRCKMKIELGPPNYFSYSVTVCKKGKRIECGPNNSVYVMPPILGGKDRLCSGCRDMKNVLKRGERMYSETANFYLLMQKDNNLVLYRKYNLEGNEYVYPVWSTETHSISGEYHFFIESDGLVQLANPSNKTDVIWTGGKRAKLNTDHQPAYMILGNSGVMAAFQCGKPYWSSFTWSKEIPLPD